MTFSGGILKPRPIYKRNHEAACEGSASLGNTEKNSEQQATTRHGLDKPEVDGRLLPAMERLYAHLQKMCQYHNYINIDTIVCYELSGFGELDCLRQGEYRVTADTPEHMQEVVLSFDCLGEQDVSIAVEGRQELERLEQYLHSHGLRFTLNACTGGQGGISGGEFIIQKHVPVAISFRLDVEKHAIDLAIVNLERLGRTQVQLAPETISEDFLDALARCVIGEKDCNCLFKYDISTGRQAIRAKSL